MYNSTKYPYLPHRSDFFYSLTELPPPRKFQSLLRVTYKYFMEVFNICKLTLRFQRLNAFWIVLNLQDL